MSNQPKVTRYGADPTLPFELANKQYADASGGGGLVFARVIKLVDETIQSDTVLHDDAELFFTPTINKRYVGYILLLNNTGSTPDIKYACTIPAGATCTRGDGFWQDQGMTPNPDMTVAKTMTSFGGDRVSAIRFFLKMGATSGNWQFQWAQDVSDASDTSILELSLLVVFEQA